MSAKSHEDFSRTHEIKASSNRSFGWVFVAFFSIVGAWPLLSGGGVRVWWFAVAGVLALVTIAAPSILTVPNRLWMKFGLLLGRIVSPVALAILFYLVVTPMGMIMRAFGKDFMRLRSSPAQQTYWIRRDPPGPAPDSLNHQF